MIPCKHCSSSGKYIDYYGEQVQNTGSIKPGLVIINCKYCNGAGYINENEILSVPRKYIKDEYFKEKE